MVFGGFGALDVETLPFDANPRPLFRRPLIGLSLRPLRHLHQHLVATSRWLQKILTILRMLHSCLCLTLAYAHWGLLWGVVFRLVLGRVFPLPYIPTLLFSDHSVLSSTFMRKLI